MKMQPQIKGFLLPSVVSLLIAPLLALGQTTVFQDTFGSSTINPTPASPGTLNSTTTAYEIASGKNASSSSIASGQLTLSTASTSSGYTEGQALFTTTPITLNAAGQYIEFYYTFTDTNNVFNGSAAANAYLYLGLYNSGGGSGPTNGLNLWNGGLSSSLTTATNGACKSWVGYTAMFAYSSSSTAESSAIGSRPSQTTASTAANNLCQALGYGAGYASGANVTTLGGVDSQPTLTAGNQYTMDMKIAYVNPTTLAITNTLYNGAGNGGTIYSAGGWTGQFGALATSPLTTTFDGLDVGYRANGSVPTTLQINSITVVEYIPAAPTISGLTNQTVIQGNNTTLSATVTGTPTPGLQWYLSTNGGTSSNAVSSATSSSLTLNNVQYSQNNYIYYLVATNSQGTTVGNMTLTVIVPPSISGLSSTASASIGSLVTFSPTVSGVPTPALQWQTNGVNLADGPDANGSIIAGSQTSTLNITNAQAADSGTYSLIATNMAGEVTNSITLTVSSANELPSFSGPMNQTNVQGSTATFTVTSVSGVPAPTVQWLDQTTTSIPGATNDSLVLNNVQYSQNGYNYYLVASNSVGMVTNGATLTVIVPPFIATQPANLVVTNTQSASFSVAETGGEPVPTYQWFKNNISISSAVNSTATNATFTIASAAPSDGASYYVQISNSAGTTNSATVTLTVNSAMSVVSLSPSNSQTGVCYDTPLYLTFSQTPTLQQAGTIKIYNVTNSTTPVDTINLAQSINLPNVGGSYVDIASNVQGRVIATETFTNFPVIITSNTAAIYPHLDLLASNQTYYVTVDNGTFTDPAGANFAGITATNAWQFTTKVGGPANPTNLIVAQDYSGDFATVQGALDSLPANNTTPTVINIRNGTYTEIVDIHLKNDILFRGQSRSGTVVGYPNSANLQGSTHYRMAFKVNGNGIALDNLTVTNMTPVGGSQAEALMIETGAGQFIFNNCNLGSYQDTLLANAATSVGYFYNSLIEGQFDYMWGGGNLFFTNCEFRTLLGYNGSSSGGNLTAARTANGATGNWPGYYGLLSSNGFSYVGCRFTRVTNTIGSTTLADSNGSTNGLVAWINCSFDTNYVVPSAAVLNSQLLWEYGNSNLTDTAAITFGLAVGDSAPALTNGDVRLLAAESATNWLNGWVPQLSPNILTNPVIQVVNYGSNATFTVVATGIPDPTYQWLFNGTNLPSATSATLTITGAVLTDAGNYSVVVTTPAGSVTSSPATLTVMSPPNSPPVFITPPAGTNIIINVGVNLNVSCTATDSVSQTLTYSLLAAPSGATLNTNTGVFAWCPTVAQSNSVNNVSVAATGSIMPGLSATNNFNVTVNPLTAPSVISAAYANGQFTLSVSGQAGPNYTVQVSTNLAGGSWSTLYTTNPAVMPFTFTYTNAVLPIEFYRILVGP
jgi:pectin methylesterase-like acyl-CoA thioesterase